MIHRSTWEIPGFPKHYIVINPFRIINKRRGKPIKIRYVKGRQPIIRIQRNKKVEYHSVIKLAAMAFHGRNQNGAEAEFTGNRYDDISPNTVCWKAGSLIWAIPYFDDYYITINPFRVFSKKTRKNMSLIERKKRGGHPQVKLRNKCGSARISIVKLACLSFHGQPIREYSAYFYGNDYSQINPSNVRWMPHSEVLRLSKINYTEKERYQIYDMYFSGRYTQEEISQQFGLPKSSISRIINHEYKNKYKQT